MKTPNVQGPKASAGQVLELRAALSACGEALEQMARAESPRIETTETIETHPLRLLALVDSSLLTASNALATYELLRTCRGCGCTHEKACDGGCEWVEADLCSKCSRPLIVPGAP